MNPQGRLELHFGWFDFGSYSSLPTWLRREINPRLLQHLDDNLREPIDVRTWLTWSPLWEAVRLGAQ